MTGSPSTATGQDAGQPGRPLQGQHALVTGAGRGIGAAVADALAGLGASVTVLGRDRQALERAAGGLSGRHGTGAFAAAADVTRPDEVRAAVAGASEALGRVAILVNNAGAGRSAPFRGTGRALWDEMLDVNLTSAYHCVREVLPGMVDAAHGRIVNVASTAGLRGYPYVTAYCAAKHGLVGLTRALALETARQGVTVNAVCPGYTDTGMTARTIDNIVARTGRSEEDAVAELVALNPQRRLVQPREVADAVAWLALPSSSAVTGQAIAVAGGEVM